MEPISKRNALLAMLLLLAATVSSTAVAESHIRLVFHDGMLRYFKVTVPSSYNGTAVPLVLDIHGATSGALDQAIKSGFYELSEKERFIVVHPEGYGLLGTWNAYDCCYGAQILNLDDVGLMRKIVARLGREFNVDRSRVYATGISNGGNLSHRLACEASDIFAGIAAVSFPLLAPEGECTDGNPMTVITYAGTNDTLIVPYDGDNWVPPAAFALARWSQINNCRSGPVASFNSGSGKHDMSCQTYSDCDGGVENTYCEVNEGEHVLYTSSNVNIAEHAWNILKRHVR